MTFIKKAENGNYIYFNCRNQVKSSSTNLHNFRLAGWVKVGFKTTIYWDILYNAVAFVFSDSQVYIAQSFCFFHSHFLHPLSSTFTDVEIKITELNE